jgi:hypothetical protein
MMSMPPTDTGSLCNSINETYCTISELIDMLYWTPLCHWFLLISPRKRRNSLKFRVLVLNQLRPRLPHLKWNLSHLNRVSRQIRSTLQLTSSSTSLTTRNPLLKVSNPVELLHQIHSTRIQYMSHSKTETFSTKPSISPKMKSWFCKATAIARLYLKKMRNHATQHHTPQLQANWNHNTNESQQHNKSNKCLSSNAASKLSEHCLNAQRKILKYLPQRAISSNRFYTKWILTSLKLNSTYHLTQIGSTRTYGQRINLLDTKAKTKTARCKRSSSRES